MMNGRGSRAEGWEGGEGMLLGSPGLSGLRGVMARPGCRFMGRTMGLIRVGWDRIRIQEDQWVVDRNRHRDAREELKEDRWLELFV